ncbi:MAG: helix-turn-helix transcriptional regulator [Firmicutes bacterium]|nr:helix-turn-helix transcriptional regulator [Bacillota bacterium]
MGKNESFFAPVAQLAHLSGYPIHLFQDETLVFPEEQDSAGDVFLCDPALTKWLEASEQAIVMEPNFRDIFYGRIKEKDYFCIVGPLKWETLFPERHREYLRIHHAASGPVLDIPTGSFSRLNDVLRLTALLLNVGTLAGISTDTSAKEASFYKGKENPGSDASVDYQSGQSLNEDAEGGVYHTPYELESRALKAVEDGKEDEFYRLFGELQSYSGGNFARNSEKYLEYSAVSMVTLLTRAAIRGGVPQKEAYAVSDLLLSRASQGKGEQDYILILQEGISQFFRLVRKYKDSSHHSYHIRKCKAFIAANLNQPLSPEIIAKELGLNKNYLMTLFSSYENESLMQYVQRKRVLAAAEMLKYTDQEILRIANYYQFQTQSHFGVAFKKVTGLSPAVYRKKNKPIG